MVAVRLPEVPVMVTVAAPGVAEPLAVSVSVLVEVVGFGTNAAVTPLGRPVAARCTLPVNPFVGLTVIVLVPLEPVPPGLSVRLLGASVSVKFGAAVTVTATVVVAVRLPEVPVMVTVVVPTLAEPLAVNVSVLVLAVGFGLNPAVTPFGRPDAARLTLPVNPSTSVTVMVLVPPARVGVIVTLPGAAASVKLGAAVTVTATVVVAVRLPEVPVMVSVVVPTLAEPLAVNVSVLVLAVGFGLNPAVTPLGSPEAAKCTLPVNPPASVTVMVLVPPARVGVIVTLGGAAVSVNPGPEVTVRLTVVVAVRLPEVPVMVTVAGPVVADALAVSVKVLVVVVLAGLNPAVTPFGKPEAARLTLPVKPPAGVTVIVLVPFVPCATLTVVGAAARVKLAVLGQWFTRLAAFTVPIPVAKSQPVFVPNAGS